VGDGLLEAESGSIVEGEDGTTTGGQGAVGGWIQIIDSLNAAIVLSKSWRTTAKHSHLCNTPRPRGERQITLLDEHQHIRHTNPWAGEESNAHTA